MADHRRPGSPDRTIAPHYRVHPIKEKFGGLRFYYGLHEVDFDPRIDDLIERAGQLA